MEIQSSLIDQGRSRRKPFQLVGRQGVRSFRREERRKIAQFLFIFPLRAIKGFLGLFLTDFFFYIVPEDSTNTTHKGIHLDVKTRSSGLFKTIFWLLAAIMLPLVVL